MRLRHHDRQAPASDDPPDVHANTDDLAYQCRHTSQLSFCCHRMRKSASSMERTGVDAWMNRPTKSFAGRIQSSALVRLRRRAGRQPADCQSRSSGGSPCAGDQRLRHDLTLLVENANRRACQRYILPDINVHVVGLSFQGIGASFAARTCEHVTRARATTPDAPSSRQAATVQDGAKPHYGISSAGT